VFPVLLYFYFFSQNPNDMEPRTILITGCSDGGLGAALAIAFKKAGWRPLATARTVSKMAELSAQGIETFELDVISDESIKSCVQKVSDLTGGVLDGLVNNAGSGFAMPLMDIDIAEMKSFFDLNVFSIITVTRSFLPLLRKSEHGGMVVNNTSLASVFAPPFQGGYAASKSAAASISEVMRLELAPFGVKVIELKTGNIKSNIFKNLKTTSIPENSIYQVAKDAVEATMRGDGFADGGTEAHIWAEGVVGDLSKMYPPIQIWRGDKAGLARIVCHVGPGWLDGPVKKSGRLDIVEAKVKEQQSASKM
jgi:1-acylglycerone phosphate reductase